MKKGFYLISLLNGLENFDCDSFDIVDQKEQLIPDARTHSKEKNALANQARYNLRRRGP